MVIKVEKILVKIYNSIKKVKRYYALLRRIYKIMSLKLEGINKELIL